jgi:hypothetical protein
MVMTDMGLVMFMRFVLFMEGKQDRWSLSWSLSSLVVVVSAAEGGVKGGYEVGSSSSSTDTFD